MSFWTGIALIIIYAYQDYKMEKLEDRIYELERLNKQYD